VIEAGVERWRRLTVKEGWRQFVADEPTGRPERVSVGEYRRLDERSRSAYDRDRVRHAHGFGRSARSTLTSTTRWSGWSSQTSFAARARGTAPRWTATRGTARRRSLATSAGITSGTADSATRTS
jgi:hypothetical protein